MNTLVICKDDNRQNELTAKLNGLELPLINNIKIESQVGSLTMVIITLVVGSDEDGGVILEKYENPI